MSVGHGFECACLMGLSVRHLQKESLLWEIYLQLILGFNSVRGRQHDGGFPTWQ